MNIIDVKKSLLAIAALELVATVGTFIVISLSIMPLLGLYGFFAIFVSLGSVISLVQPPFFLDEIADASYGLLFLIPFFATIFAYIAYKQSNSRGNKFLIISTVVLILLWILALYYSPINQHTYQDLKANKDLFAAGSKYRTLKQAFNACEITKIDIRREIRSSYDGHNSKIIEEESALAYIGDKKIAGISGTSIYNDKAKVEEYISISKKNNCALEVVRRQD